MNREEAIDVFEKIKAYYKSDPNWGVYDGVFSRQKLTEILDAYAALLCPKPDPITGLVPCGGRKAVMWCTPGEGYWVASGEIGQINGFYTEMAAKEAWNAAMGYKEQ